MDGTLRKRISALVVVFAMMLSFLPPVALAEEDSPAADGSDIAGNVVIVNSTESAEPDAAEEESAPAEEPDGEKGEAHE